MSETISLRYITIKDARAYKKLRNHKETYKWFFSKKKFSTKQVKQWLESLNPETDQIFIAELNEKIVGTCSIYNIDYKKRQAEIGRIIVGPKFRGQGIGTTMLERLAGVGKTLKLKRLYAHIMKNNKASQRAFEKAGFQLISDKELAVRML